MTVLKFGIAVALLVLGAGFLGGVHPIGNSFAVIRPQMSVAILLMAGLAFLWRKPGMAFAAAVVGCTALIPIAKMYVTQGEPGPFVLYQKNVLFNNNSLGTLAADIRASDASVVTLQEVSQVNEALLRDLSDVMPYQLLCPAYATGGVAVLTRLAPIPGKSVCAKGLAALQVQGPSGPVWVVSIHLPWPWPFRQAELSETIVPQIAGLDGPSVVAGDFNMVRWSNLLSRIERAANGHWAGPVQGSFGQFSPLADLPIDNVLAPFGGKIELRPELGSDHKGLIARLSLISGS
jgi:endonuclease/exonuclease/phosphatase (EEP) superfamily protein YafD